jgi:hypothetical protein
MSRRFGAAYSPPCINAAKRKRGSAQPQVQTAPTEQRLGFEIRMRQQRRLLLVACRFFQFHFFEQY